MEEGDYKIYVGTDVRNANEVFSFYQPIVSVVESCKEALAPNKPFMILSPISNGEGELIPGEKMVATREESLSARIGQRSKESLPLHGDHGTLLSDVHHKNDAIYSFCQ